MARRTSTTHYFPGEGREHMRECLRQAFRWSADNAVSTVIIFTGSGEGPLFAAEELIAEYDISRVVAVSPPIGRRYKLDPRQEQSEIVEAGVPSDVRDFLQQMGIAVVAAHLPFRPIAGVPAGPLEPVDAALSMLGGGLSLCVQAVLMACDAGQVTPGERVVVATGDTAISAIASRTEAFLSARDGLLVEHIICRPRRYDISKAQHEYLTQMWPADDDQKTQLLEAIPKALPPGKSGKVE